MTDDTAIAEYMASLSERALAFEIEDVLLEWMKAHGWFRPSIERADELRRMPYDEYLRTPEWQQRRRLMLALARGCCQTCSAEGGVDGARLHVHHRHYETRGQEWPDDLVVLCHVCHARIHGKASL